MTFNRFLLILLSCSLCLPLVACAGDNTPLDSGSVSDTHSESSDSQTDEKDTTDSNEQSPIIKQQNYALGDIADSLKIVGRSYATGDGIVCDLAADGIEFNAYIEGELKLSLTTNNPTYFTLFVDGERIEERISTPKGNSTVTLANLQGEHSLRLLKQTESMNSCTVLNNLEFKGYLSERPKDRRFYIEFIGDSLTSGYGILCDNSTPDGGSAIYKDATKTFAFLTAETLKADYSLVSCTGIGVAAGFRDFTMDAFYPVTSYYRDQNQLYTSKITPDAVVINLGTNDRSNQASESNFHTKAEALLAQVRKLHGENVPIVWVLNKSNGSFNLIIEQTLAELGGENAKLYTVEINLDSLGGGSHPSAASHATQAETLTSYLKNNLDF